MSANIGSSSFNASLDYRKSRMRPRRLAGDDTLTDLLLHQSCIGELVGGWLRGWGVVTFSDRSVEARDGKTSLAFSGRWR